MKFLLSLLASTPALFAPPTASPPREWGVEELDVTGVPGTPPGDSFAGRVDWVDATGDQSEVMVVAYDKDGHPVGSIALWYDWRSHVYLASDYDDGGALLRLDLETSEIFVEYTDLPAAVIAQRAALLQAHLGAQHAAQDRKSDKGGDKDTWFGCALHVAAAVGVCAGTVFNPWVAPGCFGTTGIATCKCISAWAEKKGKRKCDL